MCEANKSEWKVIVSSLGAQSTYPKNSSGEIGLPQAGGCPREQQKLMPPKQLEQSPGWRHVSQPRDTGLGGFLEAGKWDVVSSCAVSILTLLTPCPPNLPSHLDTLNSNYEDEKIVSPFYPESYKEKFCFLPVCLFHQEL